MATSTLIKVITVVLQVKKNPQTPSALPEPALASPKLALTSPKLVIWKKQSTFLARIFISTYIAKLCCILFTNLITS